MSRAGGGSSGGGHSSGGHSSSSRSSGGHHVSGSSRSHSSRAGSGGSFRTGPRIYHGSNMYHGPVHHSTVVHTSYGCANGCLIAFIAAFVIVFLIAAMFSMIGSGNSDIPASTANREKVNTGVAFRNDCIVDEIGWFDNISRTSRSLQYFYDKTGIQPYIVLKDYDPSLTTDSEKLEYAENWYEEHIDNEGTFLYMYFAERDVDNDVGYMTYVNGKQITTVMDAEAVDIFWAYLDNAWYTDLSTDDMFVQIFTKTADRIMDKSTTGTDIAKWVVIFIGSVVVLILVIKIMKTKRQHEKEMNEETERILKTPLSGTTMDDLADKYTDTGHDM